MMYLRKESVNLERFKPGNLVVHYNEFNEIKKHEEHVYRTGAGDTAV